MGPRRLCSIPGVPHAKFNNMKVHNDMMVIQESSLSTRDSNAKYNSKILVLNINIICNLPHLQTSREHIYISCNFISFLFEIKHIP